MKIQKIIMFKGGVETLAYFSEQMKYALVKRGYEVFTFDLEDCFNSFMELLSFCKKGEAILLTFNFIGISKEEIFVRDGKMFFDEYDIPCINIVVDHPFYYHRQLNHLPKYYAQYCIDKTHVKYMETYFPKVKLLGFLPLGGTQVRNREDWSLAKDRKYDILFTGNYTPPSKFEKQINRLGEEYADFYHGIIDDLTGNPGQTMDDVMTRHVLRDIPDATKNDLKHVMENMIFIDLYVRFHFRGKVVKALVDAGYKVHVIGNGLDMIPYKHPENLVMEGNARSLVCLKKMTKAKISLNVMPWFKDGAHDRIFNAALNGAVSLTDGSKYLHEVFDGKEALTFYDLQRIDKVPELAGEMLGDCDRLDEMAARAYETAHCHRWENRVEEILRVLEDEKTGIMEVWKR